MVLADRTTNRDVIEGVVGCPACQRSYPIRDGIVRFGNPPQMEEPADLPDAGAVQALLGVTTPGGNVILVGSAARLAVPLGDLIGGVHLVGVNARGARGGPGLSLLEGASAIPLRDALARGVVLGSEYTMQPWTAEAARIMLPGLRLVALREDLRIEGVERMVTGQGMWVGQRLRG